MKIFIKIVVGIIVLTVGIFILAWLNVIRASKVAERKLDSLILPAIEAVKAERPDSRDIIMQLAKDPVSRNYLFVRLNEMGKAELFPESFRAIEKVAESDLARWLIHENELGAPPSEIELIERIPVREDDKNGNFFLFRFRSEPPNWAAEYGWMVGVAGPYWEGDKSPDFAKDTFSEFVPLDQMTMEQHFDLIRNALKQKGLVVRD